MRDLFEEMLKPADKLTVTARVLTALWLGVVLVEFVIWLAIGVIGGDLQGPWWLWSVLVGGVVAGGAHLVARGRKKAR
jgi:hypothetical protein